MPAFPLGFVLGFFFSVVVVVVFKRGGEGSYFQVWVGFFFGGGEGGFVVTKGKKTFFMQFVLNQRMLHGATWLSGLDVERARALFSRKIAHTVG